MEIKNKTVIITGGARGIGKSLAAEFIRHGANVVIADKRGTELKITATELGILGLECDVTKEKQINQLVERVLLELGSIDIFVSNAGISIGEKEHSASASNKTWKSYWKLHVMAHVYAARAVLPKMIKKKQGCLVQVISAAALLSQIGDAAYSATKHAALGFAESLAITHKKDGIKVCAVCPQYVSTKMLGYESDHNNDLPTGVKTPLEIAKSVVSDIKSEKFLILPHPEVYNFMQFKNQSYDQWILQMSKLRERLIRKNKKLDIKSIHKMI